MEGYDALTKVLMAFDAGASIMKVEAGDNVGCVFDGCEEAQLQEDLKRLHELIRTMIVVEASPSPRPQKEDGA